ncbi:MAG: hypothetical protein IPJ88_13370 [Myxococcales bacterium]|nr:MAG: hypothetical protein IPJ88_13370 [Myxococcales bacterium]
MKRRILIAFKLACLIVLLPVFGCTGVPQPQPPGAPGSDASVTDSSSDSGTQTPGLDGGYVDAGADAS